MLHLSIEELRARGVSDAAIHMTSAFEDTLGLRFDGAGQPSATGLSNGPVAPVAVGGFACPGKHVGSTEWCCLQASKLLGGETAAGTVAEEGAVLLSCTKSSSASLPWVANALRWIVWSLACRDRAHPRRMGGRLCLEGILSQLRHRHDVEIHQGKKAFIALPPFLSTSCCFCPLAFVHSPFSTRGALQDDDQRCGKSWRPTPRQAAT